MKQLISRTVPAFAAVAVAALALSPLAMARVGRQASAQTATVQVKGGEFFFKLSTKTIPRPEKVTFVFKNVGHVLHDFEIHGKKTALIQPGKSAKLTVTFKKKGKYPYMCTVEGHASAGMKGTFTVK